MLFLVARLGDGALAGAMDVINVARGEWMTVGALLVAAGLHAFALGLPGALVAACAGMIALAAVWCNAVLGTEARCIVR